MGGAGRRPRAVAPLRCSGLQHVSRRARVLCARLAQMQGQQGQELFAQLDAAERGLRDARRGRATAEGELHGVREQNHRLRQAAAACRCVGLRVDLPLWLAALPRGARVFGVALVGALLAAGFAHLTAPSGLVAAATGGPAANGGAAGGDHVCGVGGASVRADAPPNPRGALGDRRRETRQCPGFDVVWGIEHSTDPAAISSVWRACGAGLVTQPRAPPCAPSVTIYRHQSEWLASCVERSLRESAVGCTPGAVSATRGADGCWQMACVLYHGRRDGVGECAHDVLEGTSADAFALCLVWAVNQCGLRSVAVPVSGTVEG